MFDCHLIAGFRYDSNNFKDQKPFHHYDENWDHTPFSLIVCPVMQAKKSATAWHAGIQFFVFPLDSRFRENETITFTA